jgi:hypothetical protein
MGKIENIIRNLKNGAIMASKFSECSRPNA